MNIDFDAIKFDADGLVPAIVQSAKDNRVLMLAYMNRESLAASLQTRQTVFFSRSRNELWHKGATSSNVQDIVDIALDCDGDTLLVTVHEHGPACHTGSHSCFESGYSTKDAQ
jgi:phosphoribosyl-AMP cyclohydrolase